MHVLSLFLNMVGCPLQFLSNRSFSSVYHLRNSIECVDYIPEFKTNRQLLLFIVTKMGSVPSPSESESPFTIHNIPYGIISTPSNPKPRCATAFERDAIDLSLLEEDGFFSSIPGFKGNNVFCQVCNSIIPLQAHFNYRSRVDMSCLTTVIPGTPKHLRRPPPSNPPLSPPKPYQIPLQPHQQQ
jgi:hypothetical protein